MRLPALTPVLVLSAMIGSTALSLPRFSVDKADSCNSCHVNPNGGGMRNEFGNYSMAFNELVLPHAKKYFQNSYRSPRLAPSLTVGFDSRYLYLEDGSLFRMQTDGYLNFEPLDYLKYHLRIGDDPHGEFRAFESYGIITINKRHYMKLGRFVPAFGLKIEDHNSFVRERTGNGPHVYLDGISLGTLVGGQNLAVEAYKETGVSVVGFHTYRTGALGPATYMAGTSMRFHEANQTLDATLPDSRSLFGGVGYNRFSLLGEYNLSGRRPDAAAVYLGLTTRLEYGLYLIAEYNAYDPDRRVASGNEEFYRWSLELYPIPFFQLRPSYTRYTSGPMDGEDSYFLQIHFGY